MMSWCPNLANSQLNLVKIPKLVSNWLDNPWKAHQTLQNTTKWLEYDVLDAYIIKLTAGLCAIALESVMHQLGSKYSQEYVMWYVCTDHLLGKKNIISIFILF